MSPFRNAVGGRVRRAASSRAEGPPLTSVAQAGRVQNGVPLHAEAVHRELVRALPVAERVEEERNGVVLRDLIAVRAVGAHETRLAVTCTDADVEVVAVVGDVHVGRLAGGGPFHRRRLHEDGEMGGQTPRVVGQQPVDDRRLIHPHRGHDRLCEGVRRGAGHKQRCHPGGHAAKRRGHCSRGVVSTIPAPSSIVILRLTSTGPTSSTRPPGQTTRTASTCGAPPSPKVTGSSLWEA